MSPRTPEQRHTRKGGLGNGRGRMKVLRRGLAFLGTRSEGERGLNLPGLG